MNENNSIDAIDKTYLTNQTKLRLSLTLFFSLTTGIVKKITEHKKKQKEKA